MVRWLLCVWQGTARRNDARGSARVSIMNDTAWRVRATRRAMRRIELLLSRTTVASRIGVAPTRLVDWERGKSRPNDKLERAWENALWREAP